MENAKIIRELNRISKKLIQAEEEGMLLVNAQCGDHDEADSQNPYPVFFTPKELMKEINEGGWYSVIWALEDREEMKTKINDRIQVLQKRLLKL